MRSFPVLKTLTLVLILPFLCGFGPTVKDGTPMDQALFPIIDDFKIYGFSIEDGTATEKLTRTDMANGIKNINYNYLVEKDDEKKFIIKGTASYAASVFLSKMQYLGFTAGFSFSSMKHFSIKTIETPYTYGDESSLSLLSIGDKPFGNLFMIRKGKKSYSVVIGGFYITEPEMWDDFMKDKIDYFLSYDPFAKKGKAENNTEQEDQNE